MAGVGFVLFMALILVVFVGSYIHMANHILWLLNIPVAMQYLVLGSIIFIFSATTVYLFSITHGTLTRDFVYAVFLLGIHWLLVLMLSFSIHVFRALGWV